MAITIDDFSKIWASTSPLTPYEFSENNYKSGWNFIGSTPPSRQMWDFLQKNNDEKMQYLADNYLPLSGGTMTGKIVSRYTALGSTDDSTYIQIDGGSGTNKGGQINLFGKDETTRAGYFRMEANDGINSKRLEGRPDGTLTWNGLGVALYKEQGYGYLIISNSENTHGVQICWGATQNATSEGITVTFQKAFPTGANVRVNMTSNANSTTWATDVTLTNFKAHSVTTAWAHYIAIANY